MDGPEVLSVKRAGGIAGQVELVALVQYEGEPVGTTRFVGSPSLGGPVVMVSPAGTQVFVSQDVMSRIGLKFGEAWVRAFFCDHSEGTVCGNCRTAGRW